MMKRVIAFFITFLMVFGLSSCAADDNISVLVNGKQLQFDVPPVIINGRTMVPMRAIFTELGATVDWNDGTQTVTATKGEITVAATIGADKLIKNGNEILIDQPPQIINGRTLVPVRVISECFDCNVSWNEDTKTVTISEKNILILHFIDVGQADSIFVQLPNGKSMLIDAGNNADGENVVNYIKNLNYKKIDYLVGTHPHEDHIGGMDNVINSFDIGDIYMPKVSSDTKTFQDVLTAINNKGLAVKTAKAGVNILNESGLNADIIAPVAEKYDDLNDYSAVIKITYLNNSFLLMGDAESTSEGQITSDVKADVIKIGHHGSDRSTTSEFIEKVSPKYAVISVGKDNQYGHPSEMVISRLKNMGISILRTDEKGTIVIKSNGKDITVN